MNIKKYKIKKPTRIAEFRHNPCIDVDNTNVEPSQPKPGVG